MSVWGILTDVTKCIGCESCVAACKEVNQSGKDLPYRWQKDITSLSATRWTTIVPLPGRRYVRKQCRHCLDPACVSVCPVGALHKTPEGPVVYNSDICLGCRYCMMSCPFAIPRYLWSEPVPYVRKCIMCYHKMKSGELKEPACTAACPTGATVFGDREELLEEAKRRIRNHPGKYIDKVWGEHEVGGTAVLYISDVPLDFLGWKKDLGTEPLPQRTWPVMKAVPGVFLGVGAGMYGIYWIIERRERLSGKAGNPGPGGESQAGQDAEKNEEGQERAGE